VDVLTGTSARPVARVRWPWALAACGAGAAASFIAWHHPVAPSVALLGWLLWTIAAARFEGLWLFVVPACLPAMNFAPWTGWVVIEEFDLVVLGAAAGGYARWALSPSASRQPSIMPAGLPDRLPAALALALAAWIGVSLWRGLAAGPSWRPDWYAAESDPLNAWRVGKSVLHVGLLAPLLGRALERSAEQTVDRLTAGMVAGAAVVAAAVLWERAAYPGLFDFAVPYRTVALFWEMHVGGAAIDAYLAIVTPFVARAVLQAATPARWCAAAALALLTEYVCLTTFSRGVYLAVGVALATLAWLRHRRRVISPRWRRLAGACLVFALLAEAAMVLGSDSFMRLRLQRSSFDFGSRLAHWQHGIRLLTSPADWAFGLGLGRLPATYGSRVDEHPLSGEANIIVDSHDGEYLRLAGPPRNQTLAGMHALTQRIEAGGEGGYRAVFDVRTTRPTRLAVRVCEIHLLYEGPCQHAVVPVPPGDGRWQRVDVMLQGAQLRDGGWPPRMRVFSMAILDAATHADLDNLALRDARTANLLQNADFSRRLAHWLPAAQHYFVPWHIDNLYLEVLIEQGMVGFAMWVVVFTLAAAGLRAAWRRGVDAAAVLLAALLGGLVLGGVSSVVDVPRVAFLLLFLALVSARLGQARAAAASAS
jgi:hypothetical protein